MTVKVIDLDSDLDAMMKRYKSAMKLVTDEFPELEITPDDKRK